MTDGPWRIELTRTALRDMRRLDPPVRERVHAALLALAENPHESRQLRKLTGAPESRLRIGEWRALLLLNETDRVIEVTRVLPRGRAYRD